MVLCINLNMRLVLCSPVVFLGESVSVSLLIQGFENCVGRNLPTCEQYGLPFESAWVLNRGRELESKKQQWGAGAQDVERWGFEKSQKSNEWRIRSHPSHYPMEMKSQII